MNILFITSTRIGDAVLSTGVLDYFVKQNPASRITVACGELPAPLFQDLPQLEKLIVLKRRGYLGHWVDLWKECFRTSWDCVIDLRGSALAYALKAKKRYIWKSQAALTHRVEQLAACIKTSPPPYPTLWVSSKRQKNMAKLLPKDAKPIIALAPAANWIGKEWPLSYFQDIIQKITQAKGLFPHAYIALFAAPHERERLLPLIQALDPNRILDFVGKLDLLDLAALLKQCDVFIGNDSGLMHMAAASGIPTLGLFGPSRSEHYAPYGLCTAYVRTPESYEELMARHKKGENEGLMKSLPPETVLGMLESLFAKTPYLKQSRR
jgi:ADP-heptose:LPS heptosyltransferase